jgi:hypothetical protein
MSDDNSKPPLDASAQVGEEMRARLRTLPQDQLVEMCAQLLSTYVVEGVLPLSRAADSTDLAGDTAGEETFAQMLKRLKATRRDPVLDRFVIDGENVSVRVDGYGVLPINEYRRPIAPPGAPAASARRESSPGAASSIYNRALYQPDAAREATPIAASQAPPQQRPSQPPAQPSPAGQPGKKDESQKDRFTLIELE